MKLIARTYTSAKQVVAPLTTLARAGSAEDILVFAAASLTNAMQQLRPQFTTRPSTGSVSRSGRRARLPRGSLLGHLPTCSFPPMNSDERVEASGRVRKEDVHNLFSNRLVVIVPADSAVTISAASDLDGLASILTGDPKSVPVVIYAKEWLRIATSVVFYRS